MERSVAWRSVSAFPTNRTDGRPAVRRRGGPRSRVTGVDHRFQCDVETRVVARPGPQAKRGAGGPGSSTPGHETDWTTRWVWSRCGAGRSWVAVDRGCGHSVRRMTVQRLSANGRSNGAGSRRRSGLRWPCARVLAAASRSPRSRRAYAGCRVLNAGRGPTGSGHRGRAREDRGRVRGLHREWPASPGSPAGHRA